MTKNEIEIIKKVKRWPFKIHDVFDRYFFIIFPLAILFVSISVTKSGFMNESINLKLIGIIGTFLNFAFLTFVIKRLYENQVFKLYKTENLNLEKIEEALKKCGFENFKY